MTISEFVADLVARATPTPRGKQERAAADRGFAANFGSGIPTASTESTDIETVQEHRRLFEDNRFVRESVMTYVAQVLEPGYHIVADSEETVDFLESWAEECAIVGGRLDRDLLPYLNRMLVESLVTGTGVTEHVGTEDKPPSEEIAALQLLRVETLEFYKLPGQNILVPPDAAFDGDEEYPRIDEDGTVTDVPGYPLAAYVQFDDGLSGFYEDDETPFRRDELTLYVRHPVAGSVTGNSITHPVRDVIENHDQKQADIAQAIRTMAYPHRYVKFGDEEYVWPWEDIEDAMEEFEPGNFEPGQSSGGPVDVNIEQYSGEVPEGVLDVARSDVDDIMTAMPIAKYELGAYEENINQFVSRSQENKQNLAIRSERRQIEAELTPIFREKAEQNDLSTDGLKLKVAPQEGEDTGARRPGAMGQGSTHIAGNRN